MASCHNSGRIGSIVVVLGLAKVASKEDDKIIVQSWNQFPKAAEQLLNKTEVIHISQEEIHQEYLKLLTKAW